MIYYKPFPIQPSEKNVQLRKEEEEEGRKVRAESASLKSENALLKEELKEKAEEINKVSILKAETQEKVCVARRYFEYNSQIFPI